MFLGLRSTQPPFPTSLHFIATVTRHGRRHGSRGRRSTQAAQEEISQCLRGLQARPCPLRQASADMVSCPALAPRSSRLLHCLPREGSRNCITHNCECDYVMKPRKGPKKNRLPQGSTGRSDSDSTLASTSSDETVGVSPNSQQARKGQVVGAVVVAPSYYVLPPSQQRLLHHMSSIAQEIETGRASNLVIYLKRLPT
jgi:hypothetical protein